MDRPLGRLALGGLTLLFLLPLGVFWTLGFFAQPSTDDFVYAVQARELGLPAFVAHIYRTWCGRYFSMAVQGWFSSFSLVAAYPIVPLTLLPVFLASLAACLKNLLNSVGHPITYPWAAWWALALGALYFSQMPSVCEGLYWLSSVVVYWLPLTLALLMFAIGLGPGSGRPRVGIRAVVCAALAFCIAGSTETLLPAVALLLALAAWTAWRAGHPSFPIWCVALAAAMVGGAILVAAPGNALRAACFDKPPLAVNLAMGLRGAAGTLLKWSARPALLGAAILALPWLAQEFDRPGRRFRAWHIAAIVGATVALVALGYLIPCVATGRKPPRRALNVLFFLFLAGQTATLVVAAAWLRQTASRYGRPHRRAQAGAAVALVVGLLAVGNLPHGLYDLAWLAPRYRQELQARYETLAAAEQTAEIEPLSVRPRSLHFADLCDEPSQASYYARYFGLREVRYSRVCPTK